LRITVKRNILAAIFFSWLAALLILTYYPNLTEMNDRNGWFRTDYLGHFGFYAVLVFFYLLWQAARRDGISGTYILQVSLAGIAFGAFTEISQQLIPGRSLNPFDMIYNCLGIIAGAVVFMVLRRMVWKKADSYK